MYAVSQLPLFYPKLVTGVASLAPLQYLSAWQSAADLSG